MSVFVVDSRLVVYWIFGWWFIWLIGLDIEMVVIMMFWLLCIGVDMFVMLGLCLVMFCV